jgi:hypothetical protein
VDECKPLGGGGGFGGGIGGGFAAGGDVAVGLPEAGGGRGGASGAHQYTLVASLAEQDIRGGSATFKLDVSNSKIGWCSFNPG